MIIWATFNLFNVTKHAIKPLSLSKYVLLCHDTVHSDGSVSLKMCYVYELFKFKMLMICCFCSDRELRHHDE